MHRIVGDHITRFHRKFRPAALGLSMFTFFLGLSSFFNKGLLGDSLLGQVVAILCAITSIFFILGFFINSVRLLRIGFLLTFFSITCNTVFVWMTFGTEWWIKMLTLAPKTSSLWMGLGVVIIAGGSYFLTFDELRTAKRGR